MCGKHESGSIIILFYESGNYFTENAPFDLGQENWLNFHGGDRVGRREFKQGRMV